MKSLKPQKEILETVGEKNNFENAELIEEHEKNLAAKKERAS